MSRRDGRGVSEVGRELRDVPNPSVGRTCVASRAVLCTQRSDVRVEVVIDKPSTSVSGPLNPSRTRVDPRKNPVVPGDGRRCRDRVSSSVPGRVSHRTRGHRVHHGTRRSDVCDSCLLLGDRRGVHTNDSRSVSCLSRHSPLHPRRPVL